MIPKDLIEDARKNASKILSEHNNDDIEKLASAVILLCDAVMDTDKAIDYRIENAIEFFRAKHSIK